MKHYMTFVLALTIVAFSIPAHAKRNYWDPRPVPENEQEAPTETIATPIIKAAPKMPSNANESGFCCMIYDVNKEGIAEDIRASFCSSKKFKRTSITSMKKWEFNPANLNGENVRATKQSRIITYRLVDEKGLIIPDRKRLVVHEGRADFSKERLCDIIETS